PRPRATTLALRDLALRLDDLGPRDRRAGRALLARPTDPDGGGLGEHHYTAPSEHACGRHVCVHWVESTADRPPMADRDDDGRPNQVEATAGTLGHVWRTVVGDLDYRRPKSDHASASHGPNGKLDVYLADIGGDGIYGYCVTDDPAARQGARALSAYCVLDDDYSRRQFGGSPRGNLRVTAAHEFFHTVQGAYDFREDPWLMEGTATWVEDEVYDGVNDNRQFLAAGPLGRPHVPLDATTYGSWVFFRFLSERFGPRVIRHVWRHAGGSRRSRYSMRAVARVTADRGVRLRDLFADFGYRNRVPRRWYDEGRAYTGAPLTRAFRLTRGDRGTGARSVRMDHLTNRHVAFRPGRALVGPWRLQVRLDLPGRVRGAEATVLVHRRDGRLRATRVRLNRHGNGTVRVTFSRGGVSQVVLTLTDASSRYRCWRGTWLACRGKPRDNDLRFRYTARAVR
ncbi:MAG: hypothetical protein M3211_05930, partial [Actinomycetota bacterium]|nr:hypothetical protein [Actinomycetota bacterium]